MSSKDQWCEQRMWENVGLHTTCELFSFMSAVAFFVVPVYGVPPDVPGPLVLVQCCLFHIGLGTMVFHSGIRPNPIYEIVDYYPMIVLGAVLMYIYVSIEFEHSTQSPYSRLASGFLLSCWVFALLYLLDDEIVLELQSNYPGGEYFSYLNTLNVVLVLPMVLIFICYCVTVVPFHSQIRAWVLLVLALCSYFLNYVACHYAHVLALFHGVYHVLMALALWQVACLGIAMRGRWALQGFQLKRVY